MRKLLPSFSMLAAVLTGCINDDSLCPADSEGEEPITMEFTVVTCDLSGKGTRALNTDGINGFTGSDAENYLDLDNTTFLLFDESNVLIKVFIPNVDPVEGSGYAKYSVRAFINQQEFQKLTGNKKNNEYVTFHIAVVGNLSGLDPQNATYHIGQKLDDIFCLTTGPNKCATFAMPISNNNQLNAWIPSIYPVGNQLVGHIPMAGIQTFNVLVADLASSTVDDPLDLSGNDEEKYINMLRALAKIEVIDNITSVIENATGTKSYIEKVELVGYNTRGSLFPTKGQWNLTGSPYETQYVTEVSIPGDNEFRWARPSNDLTVEGDNPPLVNFFKTINEEGKSVFNCYLTEYAPVTETPIWILITLKNQDDNSSTLHRLELASYSGNVPGTPVNILRNNIYRYSITGISTELALTLTVEPWESTTTKWSFGQTPAMTTNGFMEWTGGNETQSTAEVLYSGTTLVGTFAFDQPRGGSTWHANLIPSNEYTQDDSFFFVDEEGNKMTDLPSGVINGTPATIRIAATTNTTEYNRAARLVFTVHTFDGRTITANVLNPITYGTNQYFTITQNAQ